LKDISEGIRLFNETDFFAAHDFFEDCWMDCSLEEKLFFQGLVQISVGSFHLLSGNLKGSLSQYLKGIGKLANYRPSYGSINLEKLIKEVGLLIRLMDDFYAENPEKFWIHIPKLEINN
jgi:predicted metal-dependent hydrolase